MEKLLKVPKLIASIALLIFAISAFIFVLKFGGSTAYAVGVSTSGIPREDGMVFTQSNDGKTLYLWQLGLNDDKGFRRTEYSNSWK